MFVCVNCARPGKELTSSGRLRPVVPDFKLPEPVQRILIPCAGRLQPEHILKAFEKGARMVAVVACREDNCHHAEGSRRCALRVDYVRSIIEEIGLGEERLLFFPLLGSASEDLAFAAGTSASTSFHADCAAQLEAVCDSMKEALKTLLPNPLKLPARDPAMGDSSVTDMAFQRRRRL
ncbi:MAG TPA: hydrogenase iron-sulfur subunit [Acidobacteriota bacterium]|nr:hydrogenase iron-sulfur subunit [Acidobacteriota bacterium]